MITFITQVQVEQVHLVVMRHLLALVIEHQTGVEHFFRHAGCQRNGTANQPYPVLARYLAHKILDQAAARLLTHGNLVHFIQTHDGEIFRQNHQARAQLCCPLDQTTGFAQIPGDIGAGGHLYRSDLEDLGSHAARLPV